MTRINVLNPAHLCRQHLIAEWREVPRVIPLASRYAERELKRVEEEWGIAPAPGCQVISRDRPVAVDPNLDPEEHVTYTLGPGHVTSFYHRLPFIFGRIHALWAEMLRRGYRPVFSPIGEYRPEPLDAWDIEEIYVGLYPLIDQIVPVHYTPTRADIRINVERILMRWPIDADTSHMYLKNCPYTPPSRVNTRKLPPHKMPHIFTYNTVKQLRKLP